MYALNTFLRFIRFISNIIVGFILGFVIGVLVERYGLSTLNEYVKI